MLAEALFKIESVIWSWPFFIFIIVTGLYFTVRSGFFQFRYFGHTMKHTGGSIMSKEANQHGKGKLSPFQTMAIAIGACVGAGNIAGVASAIAVGGPGAVFWMWVLALVGMMVKLVEIAISVHYRSQDEQGNFYGGAMYNIERGLGREKGWTTFGKVFSIVFAGCFLFQCLQGSQAFSIAEILHNSFGWDMLVVTIVYSLSMVVILWRGNTSVAAFASKIVPTMCVVFLLGGLGLIIINIRNLPSVIVHIFSDAFTGSAAVGGFVGSTVAVAVRQGISRGINSNEAGQGSSPLIHASADTIHPVRQGLWGSFEVFIDTIVVCSITAFAILCTGLWNSGLTGATLTVSAFEHGYGVFGTWFMGIMAIFFGMTTTAGWYTFYATTIRYLFRNKPRFRDAFVNVFKVVFPCINIVIVGFVVGAGYDADLFWTIVSIVLAFPVATNLFSMLLLRGKFWELLRDYKARYMGKGQVDPNFKVFYEDDPEVYEREEAIRRELRKKGNKV